ncbi:MAG: site-2 protease family protein [Actinomycetota bacterium]
MRDSIRLGTISGISIGLHWSIVLIAALFTVSLAGTILPAAAPGAAGIAYLAVALATAAAFFASIGAHELGHSIVARNNGVGILGITLFALGGVAKLESEPDDAKVAGRIALAGPAVSVVIGIAGLVLGATVTSVGLPTLVAAGLTWLGIVNLAMAVFNMLPALPLDGGRVLQAFLWNRGGDRHDATIRAARLGRYIGWALIIFGVWQFLNAGAGGLWTALIGWFIVTSARAESFRARVQQQQERWARQGAPFGGMPFGPFGAAFGFGPQDPNGQPPPPNPQWPGQSGPVDGHGPGSFPPPAPGVIDVDGRRVS